MESRPIDWLCFALRIRYMLCPIVQESIAPARSTL